MLAPEASLGLALPRLLALIIHSPGPSPPLGEPGSPRVTSGDAKSLGKRFSLFCPPGEMCTERTSLQLPPSMPCCSVILPNASAVAYLPSPSLCSVYLASLDYFRGLRSVSLQSSFTCPSGALQWLAQAFSPQFPQNPYLWCLQPPPPQQ